MKTWMILICATFLGVGGCSSTGDSQDEPGDYSCFLCADSDQATGDDWADEAECSTHTSEISPNATCAPFLTPVSIDFADCQRKPECVGGQE